ncbi:hypothetical protein PAXINDRAFT_15814 [Paxillus involutus ATCC 200175]|uniref:Uncharacterized protein n=1 Tax=Paxillus involutus ATCC 200175 TaxID=664439 RepID=A0A0C9TTY3_PAXIN|nr:hypothetical protein PAXINDRAFT_15814 [Paxillus involutus ATCC 200175]
MLRVNCWGGRTRGAYPAVDAWCRRMVFGVLASCGRGGHIVCPLSSRRLSSAALSLPRLPFSASFIFVSLTFPSPPCLFVSPCVGAARRLLGWLHSRCTLAVDTWCRRTAFGVLASRGWGGQVVCPPSSRHLPLVGALSPSSSLVSLICLCLPYLSPPPLSPCLLFVRAARRYSWGGCACGACPAVDTLRRCTAFGVVVGLGWGLVDVKGVDVVGTSSALRRLVVCCSLTLRLSLVFPSPSVCSTSLPFHFLTSSSRRTLVLRVNTAGVAALAVHARLSMPGVEATDEVAWGAGESLGRQWVVWAVWTMVAVFGRTWGTCRWGVCGSFSELGFWWVILVVGE